MGKRNNTNAVQEVAEEAKQPEKVEFMWDDYHRQQLEEIAEEDDEDWDDDWDEDDEEGVEFIYKR